MFARQCDEEAQHKFRLHGVRIVNPSSLPVAQRRHLLNPAAFSVNNDFRRRRRGRGYGRRLLATLVYNTGANLSPPTVHAAPDKRQTIQIHLTSSVHYSSRLAFKKTSPPLYRKIAL